MAYRHDCACPHEHDCYEHATYDVAWSLDDLPDLAHDVHVIAVIGAIHGTPGADIDAAIVDRLRSATAGPADDVPA